MVARITHDHFLAFYTKAPLTSITNSGILVALATIVRKREKKGWSF